MPDDNLSITITTRETVSELQKLVKALGELNKYSETFSKTFYSNITNPLKQFAESTQNTSTSLEKASKGFLSFAASIDRVYAIFNRQDVNHPDKYTPLDKLKRMVSDFTAVGDIDQGGSFKRLQTSINLLGKGLTDLNNLSFELKLDQTIPKQLSNFINQFNIVDNELHQNFNTGTSVDSSKSDFARSSVKLFTTIGKGCADLNKQFQGLATNVAKFPKQTTIKSVLTRVGELVTGGGFIGSYTIQQTPTTSGNTKNIKAYINKEFADFIELTTILKKFSNSLTAIKSFSKVTPDSIQEVNDRIKELIDASERVSQFDVVKSGDGGSNKQIKEYVNKNFTYFIELTNLIKKFSSSLSSIKSFSKFNTEDILQVQNNLKDVIDLCSGLSEFVILPEDKNGKTVKVKTYIQESFTYFVELVNIIKKFSNSLTAIKSFSKVTPDSIQEVNDRIKELIDASERVSQFDVTNKGDKSNKKQVKQYIYDNFSYFVELANVISKFGNSLTAIKSFSKATPETITAVKSKLQMLIEATQDFSAFNINGKGAGSGQRQVKQYLDTNFTYFADLSNVLNRFGVSLNSVKSFAKVTEADLRTVCQSVSLLMGTLSEFGQTVSKSVTNKKTGETQEVTQYLYKQVEHFHVLSNVLKQFGSGLNAIQNFSKIKTPNIDNVVKSIGDIIDALSVKVDTTAFQKFERLADAMNKVSNAAANLTSKTRTVTKALESQNKTVGSGQKLFGKLSPVVRQFFTAFAGYNVIYSTVRAIQASVRTLTDLEYFMARVNTIARASDSTLGRWTDRVMYLSASYGLAKNEITQALYDINSATIVGTNAFYVLEAAAKAAVAGYTDISKTQDILSRIINAYGYSAKASSRLSDVLFKTVERGINPMEELSQYMGRVLTIAANSSIPFEEVTSALQTMTTRGYQTNIAVTALNSAILKLAQSPESLNKVFKEYGYLTSAAVLRTGGLSEALRILQDATGGSTEKLRKLGFDTRDIRAVTLLASEQIEAYRENLSQMYDAEGSTDKAQSQAADTLRKKWERLRQSVENLFLAFNKVFGIKESLKGIVDVLANIINSISRFMVQNDKQVRLVTTFTLTFMQVSRVIPVLRLIKNTILSIQVSLRAASFAASAFKASMTFGLSLLIDGLILQSAELLNLKEESNVTLTYNIDQLMDASSEIEKTRVLLHKLGKQKVVFLNADENQRQFDSIQQAIDNLKQTQKSLLDEAMQGNPYTENRLSDIEDNLKVLKQMRDTYKNIVDISKQQSNTFSNLQQSSESYAQIFTPTESINDFSKQLNDLITSENKLGEFNIDISNLETQGSVLEGFAEKISKTKSDLEDLKKGSVVITAKELYEQPPEMIEQFNTQSKQVMELQEELNKTPVHIFNASRILDLQKDLATQERNRDSILSELNESYSIPHKKLAQDVRDKISLLVLQNEDFNLSQSGGSIQVSTTNVKKQLEDKYKNLIGDSNKISEQSTKLYNQLESLSKLTPSVSSQFERMINVSPEIPKNQLAAIYKSQIDQITNMIVPDTQLEIGTLYVQLQDMLKEASLYGRSLTDTVLTFVKSLPENAQNNLSLVFTNFDRLSTLQQSYNQQLSESQKNQSAYKVPQGIQVTEAVTQGSDKAFDMLIKQVFPEQTTEEGILKSNIGIQNDTSKIHTYMKRIVDSYEVSPKITVMTTL